MDSADRHAALSGLAERSKTASSAPPAQSLAAESVGLRPDRSEPHLRAAGVTRHYDSAAEIQRDAVDARVFSGIHFRTADAVAIEMGAQVANWALDHYFAPTDAGPRVDD